MNEKSNDEKTINGVLSTRPIFNNDNRIKKTKLLRNIELEVSNGLISENLLEYLEIIEELDNKEGKKASNLMKMAYCAVAVDCTVRFLEDNLEENGKYLETVKRVWKNRVCKKLSLVSEESRRRLGDIEAAVYNSEVCEKIWTRNTRNEALKAVKSYVKEAWNCMGPVDLELMAIKDGDQPHELCGGRDGGDAVVDSENPCRNLVATQGVQNSQASLRRKHVAVKTRRPRGAKLVSDADEEIEESMSATRDDPTSMMDKVQETRQSGSMQLRAGVNVSHLDASQAAHNKSFTKAKDRTSNTDAATNMTVPVTHATPEVETFRSTVRELDVAATDPRPDALNVSFTKANKSTSNVDAGKTVPVIHTTSEVNRVQKAGKSSSGELPVDVLDPLPEVDNFSFAKAKDSMSNINAAKKKTVPVIHPASKVNRVQEVPMSTSKELHAAVIDHPLRKAVKLAATLSREGVTGNDETAVGNQTGAEIHAMPRVDSIQQASKPRSVKMHAAAQNPSPDTSQPIQNVPSKMVAKDMNNDPVSANNGMSNDPASSKVDMSNVPALANRTDVPRESTDKKVENGDKRDEHNRNNQGNGTHDPKEQHKRKRSLMERNGTSHTLEWDDSIDDLSCDLPQGPRLAPSPNRRNVSPLRLYAGRKIRRERRNWTPQEEDVLKDAVSRFGHRWKDILDSHDIFKGRTDVDLKDKWRNMNRYTTI